MRILYEDENKLEFIVYPSKYFLLFMIFLILVLISGLYNPDINAINGFTSFLAIHLTNSEKNLAGTIFTLVIMIYFLIILFASYLIPISVVIDKIAKTITYRYLAYAPIKALSESYKMVKVIPINNLEKLTYTNNIPEVPVSPGIHSVPYAIAKYCFMLKDNSSINIYVGAFSQFPHRYAFLKIADYLKIPYEIERGKSASHVTVNTHRHLIKILLFILLGLILLLVLFVGTILLIIYSGQIK